MDSSGSEQRTRRRGGEAVVPPSGRLTRMSCCGVLMPRSSKVGMTWPRPMRSSHWKMITVSPIAAGGVEILPVKGSTQV